MQEFLKHFPVGPGHLLSAHAMKQVRASWTDRWQMLFNPLHALGYATDPEFLDQGSTIRDSFGQGNV